jgi:predicted Zn-dependent protease
MKRLLMSAGLMMCVALCVPALPAEAPAKTEAQRVDAERAEVRELEASGAPRSVVQERKLRARPNDTAERLKTAEAYLTEGVDTPSKLDAASEHVDAILANDSKNVPALMLAGRIAMLKKEPAVAQAHYQAAAAADPNNAATFLALGETWSRLGNEEQASRAYAEYRRLSGMPPIVTRPAQPAVPGQAPPRIIGPTAKPERSGTRR